MVGEKVSYHSVAKVDPSFMFTYMTRLLNNVLDNVLDNCCNTIKPINYFYFLSFSRIKSSLLISLVCIS